MSARRAKSKKRRRAAFWVLFTIIVLAGVGAGAALLGSDDSNDSKASTNTSSATTPVDNRGDRSPSGDGKRSPTTTAPFSIPTFHTYKVTDGVNLRAGPGTTFPVLGTVETGFEVTVVCVINGESVGGPFGGTNKWLRVMYNELSGYITSLYVAVGTAINDPAVIGVCKSA